MLFDFTTFRLKLDKAIEHISHEVGQLRTGRASVQLLDPVIVEAYESRLKINEVATVSAPDSSLLTIVPWDKSILHAIEKAITLAGLNLNPVVDGNIIRISIPPLTQERRQEMVKILHQKIEAGRVMLRTVRTDTKKEIEQRKGNDDVSEDDVAHDEAEMDRIFKGKSEELETMAKKKETELLTV